MTSAQHLELQLRLPTSLYVISGQWRTAQHSLGYIYPLCTSVCVCKRESVSEWVSKREESERHGWRWHRVATGGSRREPSVKQGSTTTAVCVFVRVCYSMRREIRHMVAIDLVFSGGVSPLTRVCMCVWCCLQLQQGLKSKKNIFRCTSREIKQLLPMFGNCFSHY